MSSAIANTDTRLPHPDRGKAGAVGVPVRGAGKGQKGRLLPDGRFVSTDEIVEIVRDMMADSTPDGDIKRALAAKFGGKGVSFSKHIALARKRNLCQLAREPHEARADAMQQWQRLLAEAKQDKRRTQANLIACQNELSALRQHFRENPDAAGDFLEVMEKIDSKERAVQQAEKAFNSARFHVDKYQDKIDGMLGNRAPDRRENVNSNSTTLDATIKAELANPKEPLTAKEGDEMIVGMVQKLKEQLTAKAKEEATTPNKN